MYPCIKCGKEFKIKYELDRHYKRKTPCDQDKIYECDRCLKIFQNSSNLKRHLNRKTFCKKVDALLKIHELELENEKLKHVNTIKNITNNNNQIYNICFNEGDRYYKNQILNQVSDNFRIDGPELSKLMLPPHHDDMNDLKNITLFTDIIIKICFNIQRPENWRFIYDKITELLKIKINDDIMEFPDHFPEMIYIIYKHVINYKDLDKDIIDFYFFRRPYANEMLFR